MLHFGVITAMPLGVLLLVIGYGSFGQNPCHILLRDHNSLRWNVNVYNMGVGKLPQCFFHVDTKGAVSVLTICCPPVNPYTTHICLPLYPLMYDNSYTPSYMITPHIPLIYDNRYTSSYMITSHIPLIYDNLYPLIYNNYLGH